MHFRSRISISALFLILPACVDELDPEANEPVECDAVVETCDGTAVVGGEVEETEDPASRPSEGEPQTDDAPKLTSDNTMEGGAFREVWFPSGDIPYFKDSAFTVAQDSAIDGAMNYLEAHTPIDVTAFPNSGGARRLRFRAASSYCGVTYGYWEQNRSSPTIALGPSCRNQPTVLHEMFHAMGFAHEFQRPDRDDHVSICTNVDPFNYAKLGSLYWPDDHAMLSPFDFESITNSGYTGAGGCVSSTNGTFEDPLWRGEEQPLSRHDINSLYRVYGRPLGVADDDDFYGNALAAADFDDDGIEDLVVVSREVLTTTALIGLNFYKGVELDESEGRAGRLYEPWFKHMLSFTPDPNVQLSAVAGDFDGDGIPELAVGDPSFNGGDGQVHVVTVNEATGDTAPWGNKRIVSINRILASDVGLQGGRAHGFGASLAAGNITSLNHQDLIIGAPSAQQVYQSGSLLLVQRSGGAVVHLPAADEAESRVTWNPDFAPPFSGTSNEFGASVTTLPFYCDHDPNAGNDQYDTFVAGAPGYGDDAGAIYTYGCSRTAVGTTIIPTLKRRVTHSQSGARYGKAIAGFRAMSQISGGQMEFYLLVGTPGFESSGVASGKVYLDKFDQAGNKTFVASHQPSGAVGNDKFGLSLAVFQGGDLGIIDRRFTHFAIGMPRTDTNGVETGKVYMWRPFNTSGINNTVAVWSPSSGVPGMRFGKSVVTVHGDSPNGGFAIAAPEAPISGHARAGRVTVRLDNNPTSTGWTSAQQELNAATGPDKPTLN